jgi:hypothetical protein
MCKRARVDEYEWQIECARLGDGSENIKKGEDQEKKLIRKGKQTDID